MSTAICAGTYLHHIQIKSNDPSRLAEFYAGAVDMTARKLSAGGRDWVCEGPGRRILFTEGENKALGFGAFACRDAEGLAALRERAIQSGLDLSPSPSCLFGSEAFAVNDPDGNVVTFGLGTQAPPTTGLRGPLQHLTLATRDPTAIERFYVGGLGFATSDRVVAQDGTVNTVFTRSNHEHHTLACFRKKQKGLDHHSYEAGDWSVIREWCDRMGDLRIPIMWGPGRHGPGNNIFIFVEDPDGNWIEISAELEVIYDRPVKEWKHEPRTLNYWGRAIMRVPEDGARTSQEVA